MKDEFDPPQVIQRLTTVYCLHRQAQSTVYYQELTRLDQTTLGPGQRMLETSKADLAARIQAGDIKALVPSRSYLSRLRAYKIAKSRVATGLRQSR